VYAVYQAQNAAQRDLILVDQRGIGRSDLTCAVISTAGFWRGPGSLERG
jgi:hypothetical protein